MVSVADRPYASDVAVPEKAKKTDAKPASDAQGQAKQDQGTQDQDANAQDGNGDGEDEGEETFTVDQLIEGARAWLDCSPHLAAGALRGQRRVHFTIEQARSKVEAFAEAPQPTGVEEND